MTTYLTITTWFAGGRVETLDHDWPGWDLDAAASLMRARWCIEGGALVYDPSLFDLPREDGIVRANDEWTARGEFCSEVAS